MGLELTLVTAGVDAVAESQDVDRTDGGHEGDEREHVLHDRTVPSAVAFVTFSSQGYALTLQQLEYFLAAVRLGSFSAAAEELHLAQPSLSEQVRRLEAELGVPLFQRVGRGMEPTEAGNALRPHAERTLDAAEEARDSVVAVRELRGGTATFGTWGTARFYPGIDIVAEFRRRHPSVRVRMVGQNSSEVVDAVRAGELEAGMVALPIDDRGLDVQPDHERRDRLRLDRAGARARADHDRALAQAPLILPDASYGAEDPTRRQLADLAQREGVSIQPQIDVEDIEAALELAARGLGDTLVSRGILLALGRRVLQAPGLGAVRRPALRHLRVRLAHRRAALARLARVPRARARAADRAGPASCAPTRRAADAGLTSVAPRRRAVAAQAAQQRVARPRVEAVGEAERADERRVVDGALVVLDRRDDLLGELRGRRRLGPPRYQAGMWSFSWSCSEVAISPG